MLGQGDCGPRAENWGVNQESKEFANSVCFITQLG